jgi:hypothetical protein
VTDAPVADRGGRRARRWVVGVAVVVAVVAIAVSPSRGRADPSGEYRPPVPPDALSTGCYPLPGDARFDFPYQVRRDGDVGSRRELEVQYDLVGRDEAVQGVVEAFTEVGFELGAAGAAGVDIPAEDDGPVSIALSRGGETVLAEVVPFTETSTDQIVRGTIRLDLPQVAVQSDDPACSDPTSTKRYPEGTGS